MTQNKNRIRLTCLLAIVVFFLTPSLAAASLDEYVAKPLTSLPKELHETPSIAVHERTIHVVWNTYHDEFNTQIYYRRSPDNGKTWGNITKLSSNSTGAVYPAIAVHDTSVHIIWKDYQQDENPEIYYVHSTDNGETWSSPRQLTYNSSRVTNIYDIGIAVYDTNVYLVWKDYRTGSSEIFFKKSTDDGNTWTDDQRLTSDYAATYSPALAVKDSNIYVVFENWGKRSSICFMKSVDNGNSWTEKTYLTEIQGAGDSEKPNIAINKNNIYLVWQDDKTGHSEIYFKKSLDYGENWGEARQLTFNSSLSVNPKMYVYNNNIAIIWQYKQNESFVIYYKTSTDGGETWSEDYQLISNADCYDAEIDGEADNIHIVWQDYYETGWTDIWHMGNENQSSIITDPDVSKDETAHGTPGFEFASIIILLIFMMIIRTRRR